MTFGPTPVDGSTTPIPMSSVVPDGSTTPTALEGGPSLTSAGNTIAPASMYIKDGNDVTQGTSTDAANANSVIGQLKQVQANTSAVNIAKINGVTATNITLGQANKVASVPVTLATDQGAVSVGSALTEVTGLSVSANSAFLVPITDVSAYAFISVTIEGTWSGQLTCYQTNDSGNLTPCVMTSQDPANLTAYSRFITLNGTYTTMKSARYFAVESTTWSSGTATAIVEYFTAAPTSVFTLAYCQQLTSQWQVKQGNAGATTTPWYTTNAIGTQVNASATGTNASTAATLAGTAGKTTYITGFSVTSAPATAQSNGEISVSGVISGPLTYEFVNATTGINSLNMNFPTPLAATAQNTGIVVTCAALGTNSGKVAVNAYGYQL